MTEEQLYAVSEMFEGLGYQVDEMICNLDQIDHFVIVLIPIGRSAVWTMEAIKQAGDFSSIWHSHDRLLNPVVEKETIAIRMTEERLINAFNRCDPEEKSNIISSTLFLIYTELQLSHWVPAMCTCELPEDDKTGMILTTIGPFDNVKIREVRETNIIAEGGCIIWDTNEETIKDRQPLLLHLNKFYAVVTRSRNSNLTEDSYYCGTDSMWCHFNENEYSKLGCIVVHTMVPDGDEMEMTMRLRSEDGWYVIRTEEYLFCIVNKEDGRRWITIPMEYVSELEWRVN